MTIIEAHLENLDQASQFAFERNRLPEMRCRPFVLNESYDKIYDHYQKHIINEHEALILIYDLDFLVGVAGIYWILQDKYLSIIRGLYYDGNFEKIAGALLEYLEKRFDSYTLYLNLAKEQIQPIIFYESQHFEKVEEAELYQLEIKDAEVKYNVKLCNVEEMDINNRELIWKCLSKIMTEDTYWNQERVELNRDKFLVLAYREDTFKGAIYAQIYGDKTVEIYGQVSENVIITEILFKALIQKCSKIGARKLLLYSESQTEIQVGRKLGFAYYDSNICLIKKC